MKSIAEVVAEIVDRRSLPASVMMRARLGPALPGDVATWDDDLQGYRLRRDPQWIILAGRVRELWGEYFLEHHEERQPCLAL
jgi:hypothetical protein